MTDNPNPQYHQQLDQSRQLWNAEAASFDQQPDHGLLQPHILAAWTKLLSSVLPSTRGELLDIGCGTGSLSILAAGLGFTVTALDFSPEMIALAQDKAQAANHAIQFHVMDAAYPQFAPQHFDVVLCRHVLWALPEPAQVLLRWARLLKPGGRLILIEGFWHTGAGLHAQQILDQLPASFTSSTVQPLSTHPDLWGSAVHDERYLIHAALPAK